MYDWQMFSFLLFLFLVMHLVQAEVAAESNNDLTKENGCYPLALPLDRVFPFFWNRKKNPLLREASFSIFLGEIYFCDSCIGMK